MRGCLYTISELCGLLHIKLNYLDHERPEPKKNKKSNMHDSVLYCAAGNLVNALHFLDHLTVPVIQKSYLKMLTVWCTEATAEPCCHFYIRGKNHVD